MTEGLTDSSSKSSNQSVNQSALSRRRGAKMVNGQLENDQWFLFSSISAPIDSAPSQLILNCSVLFKIDVLRIINTSMTAPRRAF